MTYKLYNLSKRVLFHFCVSVISIDPFYFYLMMFDLTSNFEARYLLFLFKFMYHIFLTSFLQIIYLYSLTRNDLIL